MKKISLAIVGIILVAGIYYITIGSEQIATQMRTQVDKEITSLKTKGFTIQRKEENHNKEHLVISFNDPKKVAAYLSKKGAIVSAEDMKILKGLKVAVDITYLATAYSAVTFDIYPLTLPTSITSAAISPDDKKILVQIEEMLKRKTFLIHVDVNKLGTGFKGYLKDINEVLKDDVNVQVILSEFIFSGDIKNNTIPNMTQTLGSLIIDVDDTFKLVIAGLKSSYTRTGDSAYDYKTHYSMDSLLLEEQNTSSLKVQQFEAVSDSSVNNELLNSSLQTKTKRVVFTAKNDKTVLDSLIFNMEANNLNIKAIEALEKVDPNNEKEITVALQKLVSAGMQLEIPELSIANIETMGQKMEGFVLNVLLDVDKSLDISALQRNPMLALNALDAKLILSLSKELFMLISQQPQAIMAMMLFQPKEVKGKKVYTIELKDGKITVNGSAIM